MNAPLPVVHCVIDDDQVIDLAEWQQFEGYEDDRGNAVALPWALLEDEEFQVACARRFFKEKLVNGTGMKAALTALAAELRERAGVNS